MMVHRGGVGKVNLKLLITLIGIVVVAGVSLIAARGIWRQVLSKRALAAGRAAFEKQDWPTAVKDLREYLRGHPNDLATLRKYAESLMAVRPRDRSVVAGAISAYHRILQLDPQDGSACEKLVALYGAIENYEESAAVARGRLQQDPNDGKATLWLGDALTRLHQEPQARQVLETFVGRLGAQPGKHIEYVRACAQLSGLVAAESLPKKETAAKPQTPAVAETPAGEPEAVQKPTSLDWLNRAVAYAPDSVEALAYRARYYRRAAGAPDANEPDKAAFRALARRDLEAANALGTDDPRLRYSLGWEWMYLGELDRAAAELQAADKLTRDKSKESLFDPSTWTVARFRLGGELAMRKGAAVEAAALADETLASLSQTEEKPYRGQVLPAVVRVYVAAGRAGDARRCLSEYLTLVQEQQVPAPSAREIAGLKALVEAGDNRPYSVIELLEPALGKDPNNPQALLMLAQAYSQTGQDRCALNALEQCHRLNPQDPQVARELARQYGRNGDFEKAFDLATQAESLSPTDVDLTLLRICAAISRALRQGQSPDTVRLQALAAELNALRPQHSDRVDLRIYQSIIAASLNQPEQAERELKQAIQECKEPLPAEMQLMRHYVSAGRVEEALHVCEASCARRKDRAEPWLILSDLHVMKQDYDSARRGLQQGLETVTESRNKRLLSTKLALLELSRGDRGTGVRILKELAADPQEIQARLLLWQSREIQGDPDEVARLISELRRAEGERGLWWRFYQASLWLASPEAVSRQQDITNLLQYCIATDPGWPAPVLLLAGMYTRQRDLKQAEDVYRRGLFGNPSATEIADGLLNLLVGQGRFAEAEMVLKQIQNPRIVADWRVRLAIGAGDFSRAMDELKLRISNDKHKQDAVARIELARLTYRETKDAAQAMVYLDEAKAIAPNSRMLAAVRASILKGEGKPEEALRVLDQYVADCNNFEACWLRAAYLAEGDQPEQAERDYRKLTMFQENAAAGYELLAQYYAGGKKLDRAVAALEEGLRAYPGEPRLKRNLMQLLLSRDQTGDKERALGLLAELEKQLPQDSSLLLMRAVQKIESGVPEAIAQARDTLESIVKREPTAVSAHLALIRLAVQEGDYRAACTLAVRALETNPTQPVLLLARARAELALGYTAVAAKLVRQVLQQDPNNADALEAFTRVASSSDDRDLRQQARGVIDAAVHSHPAEERLLLVRAHFYTALGQPQGAIPELEAYCRTKEASDSILALATLADLYRLAGETARAEQVIDQVEKAAPGKQIAVHARFLWLAAQKRFDALQQISSAYIKAMDQDLATVLKAASLLVSFDPPELKKEGLKLFEHAVALWPTSVDARVGLATTLYQSGDAPRAERLWREVLEKHPNEVRALNDLAWVLQEHDQRYDAALELANKGLRLAPDHLDLLDTRGTILANLPDRLAEAKSDFERLAGLPSCDAPRRAKALLQLGRICAKLSDLPQARQYLEKATEIDQKTPVFTAAERAEITALIQESGK
jgi:tetratricopeptide (TPR) repeat protein